MTHIPGGGVRRSLLAGAMLSGLATGAHAATAAATETGADTGGSRIEEVVVTARKREESVEKVPIAITAITTQLKQANVRNLSDIVAFTPNVRIEQYGQRANAASITIRGISPSRLDDNSIDSPIGVLIDGIYLGTLTGQLIDNFDLQRIEVLRGPQGTLFGRNTIGGALNVIRTEPTGEWGANVKYTTGSWNDQEFRGVFNAPIIKDVLALKAYFFSANRDGYLHNTFLNINQPQRDYKNYGAALKFTPGDRFKAVFTFDKYEDRSQGGAFLTNYNTSAGVLAPPVGDSDINSPGTALAGTGGAELDTFLPGLFGLPNVPARTDLSIPKTINDNYPAPGDVQTWAYTLNMAYKVNPNLNIVSVTGYRQQRELASEDFDGSSTDFITIATEAHYHQFSQEVRLEGNWDTGLGKVNLVVGGYYFNSYFTRKWITGGDFWTFVPILSGFNLANNTWVDPSLAIATGFGDPISACLAPRNTDALNAIFGRVQCDPGVPGGGAGYGPGLVNKLYESQNTDSIAGFAHGDWEFYPKFTLTAGVRYTWEKKHFIGYQSYILPQSRIGVDVFPGSADLSRSWQQVTPTAALSYQATPDVLFYGSFSEGWHSGGFFGVNQNAADFLQNQYDPETTQSYEVGMKGQFFDHRVQFNLAGFINEFHNKQESSIQFDNTTKTVVTIFTNVGGLEYKGIEGELQWAATRRLSFAGSFGYLNARFTSLLIGYPGNQTGQVPIVNATFLIPRGAPEWTLGGSANYTVPVGPGDLNLNARIDWVDFQKGSLYNEHVFDIPAHSDLSLSASYAYKNYKFTVFGQNLTNYRHEIPTFVAPLFASGTVGPGASWGAELEAKF
jgi:iron complex outermembrane receptor protein